MCHAPGFKPKKNNKTKLFSGGRGAVPAFSALCEVIRGHRDGPGHVRHLPADLVADPHAPGLVEVPIEDALAYGEAVGQSPSSEFLAVFLVTGQDPGSSN